jgi:hypothetical protein
MPCYAVKAERAEVCLAQLRETVALFEMVAAAMRALFAEFDLEDQRKA